MTDQPKKKMGRPKKYADRDGAPSLNLRLDPAVYNRIKNQPEGGRAYVERLVTEDAQRCGEVLKQNDSEKKTGI